MLSQLPSKAVTGTFTHADANAIRRWSFAHYDVRNSVLRPNSGTPDTQVDVDVDLAAVRTRGGSLAIASAASPPALNKTIDLETNGASGLDAGLLSSGWHAVHLIGKDSGNDGLAEAIDVIASLSFTSPSIPPSWTHSRLIGCFLVEDRDGPKVADFLLQDSRFMFGVGQYILDSWTVEESYSRDTLDLSAFVPPFAAMVYLRGYVLAGTAPCNLFIYDLDAVGPTLAIYASTQDGFNLSDWVPCPGRKVEYALTITDIAYISVVVNGFVFEPGRGILR